MLSGCYCAKCAVGQRNATGDFERKNFDRNLLCLIGCTSDEEWDLQNFEIVSRIYRAPKKKNRNTDTTIAPNLANNPFDEGNEEEEFVLDARVEELPDNRQTIDKWQWIACESCGKWRKTDMTEEQCNSIKNWTCSKNADTNFNKCTIEEES